MPGNTGAAFSGSAIVPPCLTELTTAVIASSTTRLPAVFPVISSAAISGTPAETSEESVRDQRAIETFWTMSPILNGVRRRNASH